MQKILFTGHTGPIGSLLKTYLQQTRDDWTLAPGRDLNSWLGENKKLHHSFDIILHFARTGWNPKLLHFLKISPESRFIFSSSGAVYYPISSGSYHEESPLQDLKELLKNPNEKTIYAANKIETEKRLNDYFNANPNAGKAIALRIFTVMGRSIPLESPYAWTEWFKLALQGETLKIQNPVAVRSYIDIDILCQWILGLIELPLHHPSLSHPFQAFNLGSPEPVTMKQLADLIAKLANVSIENTNQLPQGLAPSHYLPDTRRIQNLFPNILIPSFDSLIQSTWLWYKKHYGIRS